MAIRPATGRTHHNYPLWRHDFLLPLDFFIQAAAVSQGRPHHQPPGGSPPDGHHQLNVYLGPLQHSPAADDRPRGQPPRG